MVKEKLIIAKMLIVCLQRYKYNLRFGHYQVLNIYYLFPYLMNHLSDGNLK